MKNIFKTLIASILLTACATTDTSEKSGSAEKPNDIVFTGFSESADGTMAQNMRGFICPANVNDLELRKAELLRPDGSDAFCNYHNAQDTIFTAYLSEFPDGSFEDYFQVSFLEVSSAMQGQGLAHNEGLSNTCGLSISSELSFAQLLSVIKQGENGDNEININLVPTAVFTGPGNKMSVMSVHETGKNEYLKYRYSLPGTTEEDTKIACGFLNEQVKFHKKFINEAKGIDTSASKKQFSDLLKELEAAKE